ncbi:hypothetical protein GCM10023093_17630 [Nemorincola caseinilytica]|uniref:Uncharacterized protein n=1 Tax=Nemorincola caseinilytica TaxID=2054315 RepID=A0ABP8NDC1_9BACT
MNTDTQNKAGTLNINFPGQWFIVDSKVKIHIDGKLHSTHSIKDGFSVSIPITKDEMQVQVVLGSIKSTMYKLTGLDRTAGYDMKLIYSDTWGKFSKDYKLTKDGEPATNQHHDEPLVEPVQKPIAQKEGGSKKGKMIGIAAVALILLVIFSKIIRSHNENMAFIRITHKRGTFDACYVIIPKKDPNYCFHIAVFSAKPDMAKALDNPKLSSTCYEVMRTGASTTEDYNDIFDAIEDGLGDKGCWQPLSQYYSVVDGELYENGVKLTDYLEKDGVSNKIQ